MFDVSVNCLQIYSLVGLSSSPFNYDIGSLVSVVDPREPRAEDPFTIIDILYSPAYVKIRARNFKEQRMFV